MEDYPMCYRCHEPILGGRERQHDHACWHPDCLADHLLIQAAPKLIRGRDEVYGKPRPRHTAVTRMFTEWMMVTAPAGPVDPALQHAVYMIIDKLTRLAVSPLQGDSWIDIKGYAECALESLEALSALESDEPEDEEIRRLQEEGRTLAAELRAKFDTTKNCLDMTTDPP